MKTIHFKLYVTRRSRSGEDLRLYLTKSGWSEHDFNARHLDHAEAMDLRDYFRKNGIETDLIEIRNAYA